MNLYFVIQLNFYCDQPNLSLILHSLWPNLHSIRRLQVKARAVNEPNEKIAPNSFKN